MKSSPGNCCFRSLGSTNGEVFGYDIFGNCNPERVAMVKSAVYHRFQQLMNGRLEADTLNVFVKPEPHKESKLKEGRYRLISAVSLVDTLIDRILFGWLCRKALTVVGRTPCLVGWTPIRGGWRYVYDRFKGKRVCCLDKSSWDWTVQDYMIDLWQEFIKEMCVDSPLWWREMVDLRFKILFEKAVFEFKDGTQIEQRGRGIMKSGCLLTLIMNSVGQSMIHYLAMARIGLDPLRNQPICIGDDTTQESFDELERYVEAIETFGVTVKGFKIRNWVEFIGFAFVHGTCIPAYWQKHLYNLQYGNINDKIVSYQILYANEPVMRSLCQKLAAEVDPELVVGDKVAQGIFNEC